MPVDASEFRRAMSHFTSGVTIVTTSHEGRFFGMTVASFASVSLEPPLVLVCIEKGVQTHNAIIESRHFAVSILRDGQHDVSSRFAAKVDDRFSEVNVREGSLGDPLIEGALTGIECSLVDALPGGDHTIFVGRVEETYIDDESSPLVYFRSRYHSLQG